MLEIPIVEGAVATAQRFLLDGDYYVLTIRFNERDAGWWMDIADGDNNPIAFGIGLRADTPIQAHLQHLKGMPPGVFACVDTTDKGVDPGFDDLGDRVLLLYLEEADLEEEGLL